MELEFSEDQLELRDTVRQILERECSRAIVRAIYEEGASPEPLWDTMVGLDWPGLALPEAVGGLGLTFIELAIVVEELGRATAPGPFLATATQFAPLILEAGSPEQQAAFLTPIAGDGATGTLAFAELNRFDVDAISTVARPTSDGWVLNGAKTAVLDGATADEIAVVARGENTVGRDGLGVFVVNGSAVKATPRTVIDPTLPIADLVLDHVVVPDDRVLATPGDDGVAQDIERALQVATVSLALATVGACRVIFETTLEYAKVRVQYDKIIGSFQALKHRFANLYLQVERATALAYFAALTIAEDDPRRAEATSLAKAAAGDCQRLLALDGLQLHGGIGFTWEHDLHFWLKRAKSGEALFGTAAAHRAALARMLGLLPSEETSK
jgi:alkylation response protein AidB-like acyl-CoA dehydrogenase